MADAAASILTKAKTENIRAAETDSKLSGVGGTPSHHGRDEERNRSPLEDRKAVPYMLDKSTYCDINYLPPWLLT